MKPQLAGGLIVFAAYLLRQSSEQARVDRLRPLLALLRRQTLHPEIVIADSMSEDESAAIAEEGGCLLLTVPRETFDHGGTRTMAAKRSHGEIILFLTQDALPCDGESVARLIKAFEDPAVGAAYGRQLPHPGETPFGAHLRLFNYGELPYVRSYEDRKRYGIKSAFLSNSFAAYRRSALEEIGWFTERLILGEVRGQGRVKPQKPPAGRVNVCPVC